METKVYLLILGMGLSNYIPRMVPMVVLSKLEIPKVILTWLEFVPAAVLAAILAPTLLIPDNNVINISLHNNYLIAAIPSLLVANKTKSLVWTLLTGMVSMALVQILI